MDNQRADEAEQILELFRVRGDSQYGHEAVTQAEHGLQAAALAMAEDADDALVVAALLHDVGHLLHDLPDDAPDQGIDDRHEVTGGRWLEERFPAEVVEPVRLHVPAKRYLCTTDASYRDCLSEPSIQSLELQGGLMSPEELTEFEANPHHERAVRLRRWDDLAKDPEAVNPPLESFAPRIAAVLT